MSLKGSLQTVALPEVLGFLSGTAKTGELKVDGTASSGCLWFEDGAISATQVDRGPNPVEAVFQLLRIDDGEFSFNAGEAAPEGARRVEVGDGQVTAVLEQAQQRMVEWTDIVAVVPSLDHRVTLIAEAPEDSVVLDRSQWSLVVAVGEGRPVGQIIASRDLGEFDGCRATKTLVEASLVALGEPVVEEAPVPTVPMGSPIANALSGIQGFGLGIAAEAPPVSFDSGEPAGDDEGGSSEPSVTDEAPGDRYASLNSVVDEVVQAVDGEAEDAESDGYADSEAVPMPAFGTDASFGIPAGGTAGIDSAEGPTEGRAALQALLDEVTGGEYGDEEYGDDDAVDTEAADEVVDGLADRGPWTHNELASFDGWRREEVAQAELQAAGVASYAPPVAEAEVPAAYDDTAGYEGTVDPVDATGETAEEEEEEAGPAEEPINRGLLLKFLSSVRN